MSKTRTPHPEVTAILILLLLEIGVFTVEYFLKRVPAGQLFWMFTTVFAISAVSVSIGWLLLRGMYDLGAQAKEIREALEELRRHGIIPVTDSRLKDFERAAVRIRIISPDLEDDHNLFYETVLANVLERKTYEYIIPDRPELIQSMNTLTQHLRRDAAIPDGTDLPVKYTICSQFPIVSEYVIYEGRTFSELQGFVEIRNQTDRKTTNVPLHRDETLRLAHWFDRMFGREQQGVSGAAT